MKKLLERIVRQIVDFPEEVEVKEIEGGRTSVLELSVAKQDIGKVIGKKGRNIIAIRTILNAASTKLHKNVVVEVFE